MKLTAARLDDLDFGKSPDGLLPAVVQDVRDDAVLMLGYVSRESLAESFATEQVTFFSRSRGELWRKGATSGNALQLLDARADCDRDAVLLLVHPAGPTCHTGARSCFGVGEDGGHDGASAKTGPSDAPAAVEDGVLAQAAPADDRDGPETDGAASELAFLRKLETLLHAREADAASASYTARLLARGPKKIAQKVGEEGVELALEAAAGPDDLLLEEAADLMYHYLLLLRSRGKRLADVVDVLAARHAG